MDILNMILSMCGKVWVKLNWVFEVSSIMLFGLGVIDVIKVKVVMFSNNEVFIKVCFEK